MDISKVQDTFDHDRQQKSAISGRLLHCFFFEFPPVDFAPFSPGFMCKLVRKSTPKCGENCPISVRRKKPVTSLAVMLFSVPKVIFPMQGKICALQGKIRNALSTAGNSMTSSERPSPGPFLKKEASPAVLGGR